MLSHTHILVFVSLSHTYKNAPHRLTNLPQILLSTSCAFNFPNIVDNLCAWILDWAFTGLSTLLKTLDFKWNILNHSAWLYLLLVIRPLPLHSSGLQLSISHELTFTITALLLYSFSRRSIGAHTSCVVWVMKTLINLIWESGKQLKAACSIYLYM